MAGVGAEQPDLILAELRHDRTGRLVSKTRCRTAPKFVSQQPLQGASSSSQPGYSCHPNNIANPPSLCPSTGRHSAHQQAASWLKQRMQNFTEGYQPAACQSFDALIGHALKVPILACSPHSPCYSLTQRSFLLCPTLSFTQLSPDRSRALSLALGV